MSKARKSTDDPNQITIYDFIKAVLADTSSPGQGSMNIQIALQGVLSDCIKRSSLSRSEIAARMSRLLGAEVTHYMIDSWTAESKEHHRFPAEYLPAFCEAVGSRELLRFLGKKSGAVVFGGAKALKTEKQAKVEARKELNNKIKQIETLLTLWEALGDG